MRRRVYPPKPTVSVSIRHVPDPSRLVSLDDPNAGPESARGAFARLRPPEGTTGEQTAAWREAVARVAQAVRVVPPPRAALVPAASDRSDAGPVGSIREEATALAEETGDTTVKQLVAAILDEVGA